ncbi:porin [Kushneria phosphatilytica]|uniref:porin n=1 Tax=Kushneria phosphatilytica TaxID=657387 RepID=UPI0008DAA645|nr:porin [Kushneria phosphatilytica]OHV08402.1 hypothetical protein BH688_13930 [Kushneria phosphatilytica]
MMTLRYLLVILLILLPVSAGAHTLPVNDRFTFSGFGTLGLIHNNLAEADAVRDTSQPKGADEGWSGRIDTRLGLQAGLKFTNQLDAVVQGMSQYHDTGDFSPELMQAFLRYSPDPALQMRFGRLGWDVDLVSDSRYVGYAYPWVRPPVDHFGILQLTHIDGADVTYKRPFGSDLVWLKLFAGQTDSRFYMSDDLKADFDADRVYGSHINYETGAWHFRLGYTRVESDVTFGGFYTTLIEQNHGMDADLFLNHLIGFDRLQLYSIGAIYNPGALQLQAIWNRNVLASGDTWIDSGFVSAAWRFGSLTPYVIHSRVDTHDEREDPIGSNVKQRTWSLGLRYDVATNVALKTQIDRVHTLSPGLLWRDVDDDWNGGWGPMVSLGLDFVF